MPTVPTPKRGEIWLVDFDQAVGAEIQKRRPAVVVSLDSIGRLPLRLVVPVTDWKPQYFGFPWFVRLPSEAVTGHAKESGAGGFQTKSVSLARFSRRLGAVSTNQLEEIASAVA